MKLKIIFLTIILLVPVFLISGSITHTFHFSKQDINFSTYNGYDVLTIRDGVANTEVGSPSIPYIVANFVIPSSAEVIDVQVISKKTEDIPGVYDICPVQTPRPISTKEYIPFVEPDPSIYSSSTPYPEKDIVSFPSGSMSGFRITGIFVNPLMYIPNEKKVILSTEITVNIQYREGAHRIITLTEKQRDVFKEGVDLIVLNKDDIKRFSPPTRVDSRNDVNYAIITSSGLQYTWAKLADWKNSAGCSAQVFTTNWIYSTYPYGYDDPEKIRDFLKDYFENYGLIYAVLGGDANIVPTRTVYSEVDGGTYIASDYYYSDLDSTWDGNENHKYGELTVDGVDGYFDIFVGRPPVDDQTEIDYFLNKDSVYIYDPPAAYIEKLLLPSVELTPEHHGNFVNNKIGELFPTGWTITKIEDLGSPYIRNAFNQNYNLMHIAAHGDSNGTYSRFGSPVFTKSEIPNLTNTMPTVFNSIACYCGDFDEYDDCFAEALVTDSAGCVATIMNSRYGWGNPPGMGPSETMDAWFYNVMNNDTLHIGIIHGATKNQYCNSIWFDSIWHYCGVELNLFGDPEMGIFLGAAPMTPTNFRAEAVPWQKDIDLSWDNVPREQGYRIYRSTTTDTTQYNWGLRITKGADDTSATDYCASWSWIYYYYIVSYNSWGESPSPPFCPIVQETSWVQDPEITDVYPWPYSYGPYMKIEWEWYYDVYGADSIVYYQSGPTLVTPPHPHSWFDKDGKQTSFIQEFWLDNDGFPDSSEWVGYYGEFYTTKGGQQWNPLECHKEYYKRPGPDPPVASTADTFATAYSNSRKIVVDSNDRMHITFTSNDTVYYVYSDDCEIFSTPVAVGNGRYPGIALDGNEYPHICWVRENMEYEGYILYHSKLTQSGWTSPDELLNESATEFTPPSFDIDKADNVASLTWADFHIGEEKWIFYKGSFSLLDTTPYIEPVPYDTAVQMSPESPNYICDQEGLVDGYLLWEKEGDVYSGVELNGVVQYITNISNSLNTSIHPNLSIWGDSLYAVWQEEFLFENKILFSKRATTISSNWEDPVELTFFPDTVEFPACHGPFIVATGKTKGGNYDISILRKDEFGDIQYIYGITETNTKSKFPAVCYTQNFPEQKLYVIWTEDTTSTRGQPVHAVKAKMIVETTPIPKIAVNLGSSDGSPYTIQREGYEILGYRAYQQIDYHPQELIYRFTGLKSSETYKLKLIFYYKEGEETPKQMLMRVKADGHSIGGVIVNPDEPTYFEKWIPTPAYQSGTVDITIERWKGNYAVCSEIFLYEYEKNNGSEGAQLAENLENFPQKMQFIAPKPNPFMGSTKIGFVIPQKEEVTLKIYDVTGRLCKTLVKKKLDAGTYYFNWDGKGEYAKRSVCGVYFSVLNVGEKRFVRKIVKIN